jgi:hypothetical protein
MVPMAPSMMTIRSLKQPDEGLGAVRRRPGTVVTT